MASGDSLRGKNFAVGTVTGTGSAITVVCGFKPTYVSVRNTSGNCYLTWNALQADAAGQKSVDSGAAATDISTISSGGITPSFNGFTIGTDTDINVNTEVIFWEASKV